MRLSDRVADLSSGHFLTLWSSILNIILWDSCTIQKLLEQFLYNFNTTVGQQWDMFVTTLWQLWDNFIPLLDNFETILEQHSDNFLTTMRQFSEQILHCVKTSLRQLWDIFIDIFSTKLVRQFLVSFVSIGLIMWSIKMFIVVCCIFLKNVSSPINSAKNGLRAVKFGKRTNWP